MLGVAFNMAIFTGGVVGAGLIGAHTGLVLPVTMTGLAAVALVIAVAASCSAFSKDRHSPDTL